ncbi:MAG: YxeA family protein [Ruminococcus sp.]|nr:YxeA family protein [Ruminococcus sp.]
MNKKVLAGILAAVVIVVAAAGFGTWYLFSGKGITLYYTQIDNTKIEHGDGRKGVIDPDGGMEFYYTLPSYDKDGNEKEIRFGASKELRDGAFLRVSMVPIRGAVTWIEVQYDELPVSVREKYVKPSA